MPGRFPVENLDLQSFRSTWRFCDGFALVYPLRPEARIRKRLLSFLLPWSERRRERIQIQLCDHKLRYFFAGVCRAICGRGKRSTWPCHAGQQNFCFHLMLFSVTRPVASVSFQTLLARSIHSAEKAAQVPCHRDKNRGHHFDRQAISGKRLFLLAPGFHVDEPHCPNKKAREAPHD